MSKGKTLLDFYPVVKAPRDLSRPPTKRIKVTPPEVVVSTPAQKSSKGRSRLTKNAETTPVAVTSAATPISGSAAHTNNKWYGSRASAKGWSVDQSADQKTPASQKIVAASENSSRKRRLSSDHGGSGDHTPLESRVPTKRTITPTPLLRKSRSPEVQSTDLKEQGSELQKKASESSLLEELSKTGKIDELKETLSKLNVAKAKRRVATPTAKRELFPPIENFESPLPKVVPEALERVRTPAATSDSPSNLTLPYKYTFLADVFHSTDTVAAIVHNRQEVCTFAKMKPAVQEMMRRNFHLKHLGQIKSVYPSAYIFKQEKILCRSGGSNSNNLHPTIEPQLTIAINTDCSDCEDEPGTSSCVETPVKRDPSTVDPSFLLYRRRVFRKNLVHILMEHHNKFLSTLNPPITLPANKIHRWHPSFPIEDVPEVTPADLPEAESSLKYMTAKDVLAKVKGLYSKKLDKALENVVLKSAIIETEQSSPTVSSQTSAVESMKTPEINSKLKGIPLQLLEKIRAKEAEKIKAEMTRSPAAGKRKVMISRLPEIIRILRNYFIAEKKAAIPVGSAIKKIGESFVGSLTPIELEDHLNLLAELVPSWLSCVTIKCGVFLKLNRLTDVNSVIEKVIQIEKAIP